MYDCIVLGTGGIGSAALYHLARRDVNVLGIDRFPPGHDRGSSHGDTRVIRLAYMEHPDYVPLLFRAYDLWRSLAESRGESLGFLKPRPTGVESSFSCLKSSDEKNDATREERRQRRKCAGSFFVRMADAPVFNITASVIV